MYIATIKNGEISIPIHNGKQKLLSGKVTKGINTIDSFQFTMLPSNVGFDEIYDYTTLVTVYNTNRRRYEFYGRVLYSDDDMSESGNIHKDVICENYFGFFCDSQQDYVDVRNWKVRELFQYIVNVHNSQVEDYKQFTVGEVTVTDPNDNIYCGIQRKNTWETFKETLLDTLGGELRFRVDDNVNYIDYVTQIGVQSETEITLSKNMKSITREKDPSEIVTRLIPLGCKLTGTDEEGQETETEYRLDITSVNGGKNYVEDETAIKLYGIRVATVEFDDVTDAKTLKAKGEKQLQENNKIKVNYTATALDLSLIGLDVDDFDVGNYHGVKNHLLGINDTVRIIKKSIDICEEVKSTIEFGDNFEKLSDTIKKQNAALNAEGKIQLEMNTQYSKLATRVDEAEGDLELKVGVEEYDLIVEMLNKAAQAVELPTNRLKVTGENFSLSDGVAVSIGEKQRTRMENGSLITSYSSTELITEIPIMTIEVDGVPKYSIYFNTLTMTIEAKAI